jgi:hypothetical protein
MMKAPPPVFFLALIEGMFRMPRKFACRLWQHVDASPLLLWQLSRCDTVPASHEVWMARVKRLADVLPGSLLIEASVCLSPEGQRRDHLCIVFEEAVLRALDASGTWKW